MAEILRFPEVRVVEAPLVYLFGPDRGTCGWHDQAIARLSTADGPLVIADPRAHGVKDYDVGMHTQWGITYRDIAARSGVILGWMAGPIFTVNGNFGQKSSLVMAECIDRHLRDGAMLALGIEAGFPGGRDLREYGRRRAPFLPIKDSLDATCQEAMAYLTTGKHPATRGAL